MLSSLAFGYLSLVNTTLGPIKALFLISMPFHIWTPFLIVQLSPTFVIFYKTKYANIRIFANYCSFAHWELLGNILLTYIFWVCVSKVNVIIVVIHLFQVLRNRIFTRFNDSTLWCRYRINQFKTFYSLITINII